MKTRSKVLLSIYAAFCGMISAYWVISSPGRTVSQVLLDNWTLVAALITGAFLICVLVLADNGNDSQ